MVREMTLIVGFNDKNEVIIRNEIRLQDLQRVRYRLKAVIKFMKKDKRVVKITINGLTAWTRS